MHERGVWEYGLYNQCVINEFREVHLLPVIWLFFQRPGHTEMCVTTE